ncbi:hypothetical protein, conserved [Leishmania tarentolae]|uniref:Uncharacterized protein n=1 Tax=Leishmania tarentolae TaxID=5689 RepID=A0A640KRX1_LEITA|nr:hypothetical protein, conserved [Leishmania tarentolae]
MYQHVSQSGSPSVQSHRVPRVNLDTLEELQDAWSKRYETLRYPPPPPLLNSPRSLRACELANVSSPSTLQKLSLKQHLFRVLGNPQALSSLPDSATAEYQALMQSALRSFSEAAVGLGTSQEKLAAFIAFMNQEKLRVPHLASLRELRRQLVAKDSIAERRPHQDPPNDNVLKLSSNASSDYQDADGQNAPRSDRRRASVLCSSKAERSLLPSPASSVTRLPDEETTGVQKVRAPSSRYAPLESASAGQARAATGNYDDDVCGSGALSFAPTPSPSGKLPYKPRDVSLLNSSYFGNRTIRADKSNPCGAPLPTSSPGTPSPSWPVTMTATGLSKQRPHSQQPRSALDTSFGTVIDVNSEFSVVEAEEAAELRSAPKQDTSIVSINSSQLELLYTAESEASSGHTATAQPSSAAMLAMARGGVRDGSVSKHTVTLFHESNRKRGDKTAAEIAAELPVASSKASFAEGKLTPFSYPLARRGPCGYTNHGNFLSLLVPNEFARAVSPPKEITAASTTSCVAAAATSPSENDKDVTLKQKEVLTSKTATPIEYTDSTGQAVASAPSQLPSPPVLTQAEESDGFLYYCANPSYSIIKSYAGSRQPLAVSVKL